ncbi:MAG TPA: Uma2 family endonuclease [Planctomycetota bacterium]|nr:Uma2 family endonuclease [Planctomycetota bacterium]
MAITTAEELLRAQDIGRCELVRGELHMMVPPGFEHGWLQSRIALRLGNFVEPRGLGVLTGELGFVLARNPDTVRAPDVAFIRAERVTAISRGYFEGAPDLAVEILSPDDRPGYVRDKVAEWLESGTGAVWVVDPRSRTVTVHEPKRKAVVLAEADVLRGSGPLNGFELRVGETFTR